MQPLTTYELSLVEEIMSGRFGIPLDKEAKALLEGVASSPQKNKGKRKRLLDTRVVDEPEAYKLSKVEAASTPYYNSSWNTSGFCYCRAVSG